MASAYFVRITGPYPAGGGTELVFTEGLFPQLIFELVVIEHDMGVFTDEQPAPEVDISLSQPVDFFYQYGRVNNHAVAYYADSALPNGSAGHDVQGKSFFSDDNGVSCVCTAAVANDYIAVFGKDIDDLALTLIPPLQTNHTAVHLCQNLSDYLIINSQKPGLLSLFEL
jgi:hypothetical protein